MKLIPIDVEWEDASSTSQTWADSEDVDDWATDPHMIHTRGYLIKKTKSCLIVASSLDLNNESPRFSGLIKIPIAYIRKQKGGK